MEAVDYLKLLISPVTSQICDQLQMEKLNLQKQTVNFSPIKNYKGINDTSNLHDFYKE